MVDLSEYLDDIDLDSIALPDDKFNECHFFFELLSRESRKSRFRWLLSAFLGACYSYLEIKAASLYFALNDPETGDPVEDYESLEMLRKYVRVFQDKKNYSFIKTSALHRLIKQLYRIRNANTHNYALSIIGEEFGSPADFKIGYKKSAAVPALQFCREILALFSQINEEID